MTNGFFTIIIKNHSAFLCVSAREKKQKSMSKVCCLPTKKKTHQVDASLRFSFSDINIV